MQKANKALFLLSCFLVLQGASFAAQPAGKLPLPRFASLRSGEVNMRRGPGTQYPLDWVYVRKDLPVEITSEFETWRQIRDVEGTQGWVHQSMLSGKRCAMTYPTRGIVSLKDTADAQGGTLALLEPGAQGKILTCKGAWCKVQFERHKGWLKRQDMWGVYGSELIK
ncbi:MAG: hypothetical protein C0514_05155 [Candidatus Puniceispirillum sp.]|nr:hypothetical protein [Candidatus Puniceispirillum sp.]